MAVSRLHAESEPGTPVRLVAERIKASGKVDGLLSRLCFLGQADDLRLPMLERLMASDRIVGASLGNALTQAQRRMTGAEPADLTAAFHAAGASFSRRVLLVAGIRQWNLIFGTHQGINAADVAKQSLAMAHVGLWFGKFSKLYAPDAVAAAMTMHGIGFATMGTVFGSAYGKLWRNDTRDSTPLEKLELESFGVTHGEAGSILLKSFGAHADVVACLQRHGLPLIEIRELPLMMAIAEHCAAHMGWDGGYERNWGELPVASMLRLGLKEADLKEIRETVQEESAAIFG